MARPKGTRKPLRDEVRYAVIMLVWGRLNKTELCKDLGISRMALWKWEQREDYQALYEKEYRDMVGTYRRIGSKGKRKKTA